MNSDPPKSYQLIKSNEVETFQSEYIVQYKYPTYKFWMVYSLHKNEADALDKLTNAFTNLYQIDPLVEMQIVRHFNIVTYKIKAKDPQI